MANSTDSMLWGSTSAVASYVVTRDVKTALIIGVLTALTIKVMG